MHIFWTIHILISAIGVAVCFFVVKKDIHGTVGEFLTLAGFCLIPIVNIIIVLALISVQKRLDEKIAAFMDKKL